MIVGAAIVATATLAIVYSPVGALFEFVPLPLWFLTLIFAIMVTYFLLVEMTKHIFSSRYEI